VERLPLFERNLIKKIAEERLRSIAEVVAARIEQEHDPGLLTGLAGQAIFLYHFGRTFSSDRHENLGFLTLRRIMAMIEEGFSWPSYAAGLAGIRSALHYLASINMIGKSEGNSLEGTGSFVAHFAEERFLAGDYDFLHGGLGAYDKARGERREKKEKEKGERRKEEGERRKEKGERRKEEGGLEEILKRIAKEEGDRVFWESRNPKTGVPEVNLGLAHGIPSILLMLSRETPGACSSLLEKGVAFLLSCRMESSSNGSLFPHRMVNGKPDQPGRLAWCYGDPGVGAALWQIGANCGNEESKSEGLKILRVAASRKTARINRVYDACLCHGTAGLAVIFYKMGLVTGHDELIDAAEHWMRATLDHGTSEGGAAGYLYLTTGNRYVSNFSFLEGLAGTGLAILTLLEPDNLGWEKLLLL
jgi:lantibiotic modifying enzyme